MTYLTLLYKTICFRIEGICTLICPSPSKRGGPRAFSLFEPNFTFKSNKAVLAKKPIQETQSYDTFLTLIELGYTASFPRELLVPHSYVTCTTVEFSSRPHNTRNVTNQNTWGSGKRGRRCGVQFPPLPPSLPPTLPPTLHPSLPSLKELGGDIPSLFIHYGRVVTKAVFLPSEKIRDHLKNKIFHILGM